MYGGGRGVDQGLRIAARVIDGVPGPYRRHTIMETGRMVLRAVPAERQDRPAVGGLREMLESAPELDAGDRRRLGV